MVERLMEGMGAWEAKKCHLIFSLRTSLHFKKALSLQSFSKRR
jgi:hypothetical protein